MKQKLDPQMHRFLETLSRENGFLWLYESDFYDLDQSCIQRAKELNFVSVFSDGALGANFTIHLNDAGWLALGIEPPAKPRGILTAVAEYFSKAFSFS